MLAFGLVWALVAAVSVAIALRRRSVLPLPPGVAAAFAIVALLLGGGLIASCFIFATVVMIGRWALRPVERAASNPEPRVAPGLGSIVGMPAIVVERISNDEAVGCVRIAEELWSARTPDGDVAIEPGQRVHVVEVRGSTAIVSP